MFYRICLLLTIVVVCILIACSDNPINSNNSNSIIPLEIGNQWWSTDTQFDSTGNITSSAKRNEKIISKEVFSNIEWSLLEYSYKDVIDSIYYSYHDGFYRGYDNGYEWEIFKYPGIVGDFYSVDYQNLGTIQVEILDTSYLVSNGSASFTCYLYSSLNSDVSLQYYSVAPHIGIIKIESYVIYQDSIHLRGEQILDSFLIID